MALNANHAALERRSGKDLRDRLRGRLVFADLTFTGFVGSDIPFGGKLELVYPDEPSGVDTPGTVSTSRTPDWASAETLGSQLSELHVIRSTNQVTSLPYADIESSPFNQIESANERMSRKLARTLDDDLADAFIAGVPSASKNTPAVLGDANAYIDANGILQGSNKANAQEFVIDSFIGAAKWALAEGLVATGERDYDMWAVCPGQLWATWLDFIKEEKPSDSLFNMFVGPGSRGVGSEDRQNNIRVIAIKGDLMPTATVGGKAHAQILFGTNRAMVFAAGRPVMSSVPVSGSTSGQIGATYGQAIFWGRTVLNPEQLRIARIRQAA